MDIENDNTTKLRPGLMISLHTEVSGGVSYTRENLDPTSAEVVAGNGDANGAAVDDARVVEKWNTTKIVEDAAEHKRATEAVSKARGAIAKLCFKTAFGLLCPKEREGDLKAAITQARQIIREFNATAQFTHARIYVLRGDIASTEEESARAIGDEVSQLVAAMNAGIDRLNPEAIREAANKARQLQEMLGPDQAEVVKGAIEQARKAARAIVKRIQNEGEAAEIVLKDVQRGSLEKARIAFLDLTEQSPDAVAATLPAVNVQRLAGLDLDANGVSEPAVAAEKAVQ